MGLAVVKLYQIRFEFDRLAKTDVISFDNTVLKFESLAVRGTMNYMHKVPLGDNTPGDASFKANLGKNSHNFFLVERKWFGLKGVELIPKMEYFKSVGM
mmetsp:Transcript_18474/g.18155  ORF Transcript_18474/g.18155 Transcript_18474/m.18155 type:complete len:99 (+) Transcript_18474:261-557(+)